MDEEVEGIDCSPCCRNERFRETAISVLLGQVLSLCLCGTAVTSQLLSDNFKVNTPTAQGFANYFFLCLIYGTILACKSTYDNGLINVIRARGWKYALLALIDVEANYLVVRAYQYTNLTSVQILDCFTIPIVLILSFFFLHTRYLLMHIVGVGVCLVGIGCLIWGDVVFKDGNNGGENRLLGDILCLSGAALYGIGNVGEEYLVKNHARMEYLGMIGLFGSVISGIQLAVVERHNLSVVPWHRYEVIILYLSYAVAMFAFYSLVVIVMQRTSATLFNLSILTADFYALLIGKYVFQLTFHPLYLLSFALVLVGSIIYSIKPTHKRQTSSSGANNSNNQNQDQTTSNSIGGGGPLLRRDYDEIPPIHSSSTEFGRSTFESADGGVVVGTASTTFLTDPDVTVKYCPVHGTVMVPRTPAINQQQMAAISQTNLSSNEPGTSGTFALAPIGQQSMAVERL